MLSTVRTGILANSVLVRPGHTLGARTPVGTSKSRIALTGCSRRASCRTGGIGIAPPTRAAARRSLERPLRTGRAGAPVSASVPRLASAIGCSVTPHRREDVRWTRRPCCLSSRAVELGIALCTRLIRGTVVARGTCAVLITDTPVMLRGLYLENGNRDQNLVCKA